MDIDFLEYKVRNGDTLNSIASRLGITGEELKSFHNSHCQRMNRIWFEHLNEVKSILVPIHIKTEKQKDQERTDTLPSSQQSDSFFAKTYNVSESFESPFETPLTIDYRINLDVRKDQNKSLYIVSYRHDQFKTNGETPDNKMSELSIACMKSIMPIDFILSDSGKITGLADHKKVTQTFTEKRQDIEGFYMGEVSMKYINIFEKSISDESFFLHQFQSTLLFQTLFPKMDWFGRELSWTEPFYFFQNSFPVQCNLEIEQEDEDTLFLTTIIRGNIVELYSLQELKTGQKRNEAAEHPVSGEIIIEYNTHKKNKTLTHARCTINLWHEGMHIKQHTITITQG